MALEKITMPQLGESVTEGTISNWLVSVGDSVSLYDPLAEVMTDKVNAEIPSSYSGIIKELIAAEGDTLSVGDVICTIEVADENEGQVSDEQNGQKSAGANVFEVSSVRLTNEQNEAVSSATSGELLKNKRRYSPAVLKLSQEYGIDLEQVNGSGTGGRITRKDLLALINAGTSPKRELQAQAGLKVSQQESQLTPKEIPKREQLHKEQAASLHQLPRSANFSGDVSGKGDIEIPVSGVRKLIAANMVRSKQEVPHAWTMIEVDVTGLVELRNSQKDAFLHKEGFPLTYFAFFIKAVARALKEFPEINSMWAGDKIIQKQQINISIAVATDSALYVPVIKNADEKSIKGIARDISDYAAKTRAGRLTPEDIAGGTFTVNNTGSFGSVQSMGIINYPQAAILQVESIVKRPVIVNDNMIAIRDMVNLCMSLDHRVLDGLICGRFLQRVKALLEGMSKETTSIY